MVNNDDSIHVKLPKELKDRFTRALHKRLQTRARVLRRAIEEYCDDADRMGTPKRIK